MSAPGVELFVAVSMYAIWESPQPSTGSSWIGSDASAHRIIADLSMLIGRQSDHLIAAAGDLNILLGHRLGDSRYLAGGHATVFDRMGALRLAFLGPQAPDGWQADQWPDDLPAGAQVHPRPSVEGGLCPHRDRQN